MSGDIALIVQRAPWGQVKQHLMPLVRGVVYGMFANRCGRPERIEATDG
jgi:hypothetical protein